MPVTDKSIISRSNASLKAISDRKPNEKTKCLGNRKENNEDNLECSGYCKAPHNKLTVWQRRSVLIILSIAIYLERLAFYNVTEILIMVTHVSKSKDKSGAILQNLSFYFTGATYFLPIFAGLISGAFIGRFLAIVIGSCIYLTGCVILSIDCSMFHIQSGPIDVLPVDNTSNVTLNDDVADTTYCQWSDGWLSVPLLLIACGAALVKTCLYPFFIHQVTHGKTFNAATIEKAFAWLCFCLGMGQVTPYIISNWVLSRVMDEPVKGNGIPTPIIGAVSMTTALVLFLIGRNYYIREQTNKKLLVGVLRFIRKRFKEKRCCCARIFSNDKQSEEQGKVNQIYKRFSHTCIDSEHIAAYRKIGRSLPIFGILMVIWYFDIQTHTVYDMQIFNSSSFTYQLNVGTYAADVLLFEAVYDVFFIPVLYVIIYPVLQKVWHVPSIFQKIGTGIVCITLSLFIASWVEFSRKTANDKLIHDFWAIQIPQYCLIALGEGFFLIPGYTFSYMEAPKGLEDLFMGMYLSTVGLSVFTSVGITKLCIISGLSWLPEDNVGPGHIEYLMWILASISILFMLPFMFIAQRYEVKRKLRSKLETEKQSNLDAVRETDDNRNLEDSTTTIE